MAFPFSRVVYGRFFCVSQIYPDFECLWVRECAGRLRRSEWGLANGVSGGAFQKKKKTAFTSTIICPGELSTVTAGGDRVPGRKLSAEMFCSNQQMSKVRVVSKSSYDSLVCAASEDRLAPLESPTLVRPLTKYRWQTADVLFAGAENSSSETVRIDPFLKNNVNCGVDLRVTQFRWVIAPFMEQGPIGAFSYFFKWVYLWDRPGRKSQRKPTLISIKGKGIFKYISKQFIIEWTGKGRFTGAYWFKNTTLVKPNIEVFLF